MNIYNHCPCKDKHFSYAMLFCNYALTIFNKFFLFSGNFYCWQIFPFSSYQWFNLLSPNEHNSTPSIGVKAVEQCIITRMLQIEIAWPDNISSIVAKLYKVANFPGAGNVIDGTLVKIYAPHNNEEAFVDRHGNHPMNCMFLSGFTYMFYYEHQCKAR